MDGHAAGATVTSGDERWSVTAVLTPDPAAGGGFRCTAVTGSDAEASGVAARLLLGRPADDLRVGPSGLLPAPCAEVARGGTARRARVTWAPIGEVPLEVVASPLPTGAVHVVVLAVPPGGVDDEVRAERDRWRAMMRHLAGAVAVIGADGTLRYHGPPSVLGYDEGDLVGEDPFRLVHPGDTQRARVALEATTASAGRSDRTVLRLRHADGSWRWVEVSSTNLLHEPAVAGLLLNLHDVGDRVAAEAGREASEGRFETLAGLAPVGVFVADAEGRIRYANRRVEDVVGVPVVDLLGHDWRRLVDPEDTAKVRRAIDRGWTADTTVRVRRPDGTRATVAIRAARAPRSDDRRWAVIGTVDTAPSAVPGPAAGAPPTDAARGRLRERFDPVTGLADRRDLMSRLEHELREGSRPAVLFVDLDAFAGVNAVVGERGGDVVLAAAAARMQAVLRPDDVVARHGGDEFVVLGHGADVEAARDIAGRLLERLAAPFAVGGERVRISASIGIAHARPGSRPADLLRVADAAMGEAKRAGGNRFQEGPA